MALNANLHYYDSGSAEWLPWAGVAPALLGVSSTGIQANHFEGVVVNGALAATAIPFEPATGVATVADKDGTLVGFIARMVSDAPQNEMLEIEIERNGVVVSTTTITSQSSATTIVVEDFSGIAIAAGQVVTVIGTNKSVAGGQIIIQVLPLVVSG